MGSGALAVGLALLVLEGATALASSVANTAADYPGYSVSVSSPVGMYSDHVHEYEVAQRNMALQQKWMDQSHPRFQAGVDLFAHGGHAHQRFRRYLDLERTAALWEDHQTEFALPELYAHFRLHVKKDTPESIAQKVTADFALAQLGDGGLLADVGPGPYESTSLRALPRISEGDSQTEGSFVSTLLRYAKEHRATLESLVHARGGDDQAVWMGKLLLSALDGREIPKELFRILDSQSTERSWGNTAMTLLCFAPDSQWEKARDRVRASLRKRFKKGERVVAWMEPLLAAE